MGMHERRSRRSGTAELLCSGAILAGGKSTRMGTNKALLAIKGQPLIARVASVLSSSHHLGEVLLITNTPSDHAFLQMPMYEDVQKGLGPLGGIHTALHYATCSRVLIVACDLPFITAELVNYLCANCRSGEIFALESTRRIEPLCAVYAKSCLPVIERQIREGRYKVLDLYSLVDARTVRLDAALPFYRPNLLANVNTPEEFAAAAASCVKDAS